MSVANLAPILEFDAVDEPGAQLARIERQLAAPRRDLERAFLDMGQHLLDSIKLLNEITAAHEGMPAELESAEFNTAAQHLETIRDEVAKMAASHVDEGDHIERLTGMAQTVSMPLHDLRKAVRTIGLIAVNAKIAAAGISGPQGELSAFTTDMMELGQEVEKAVAAFAGAHRRFVCNLAAAKSTNAAFIARHGGTMDAISSRLTGHMHRVNAHRERARERASEHAALTGQVRGRIGLAVSALQIGDITRQRVEHVEQTLAMLAEYVSHPEQESRPSASTIIATYQLTERQLEEALLDFDHKIVDLAQSLRQLARDAADAVEAGGREAEAALSDGDTALGATVSDLGEISALFRDFAETRAGTEKMAAEVSQSVVVMVGHLDAIGKIEHKIRLLSLNTAIQCGRLGEDGRALRVIAQDLQDIAAETVVGSGAVMEGLDDAERLARLLIDGETSALAHRIAELQISASAAIGLLGAVSERMRGRMATMISAGPRAVRQLDTAASHVSGQRDLGAAWGNARADIRALAVSEEQDSDIATIDGEFFARVRASYTMDSERNIHDALLGSPPEREATADTVTAPEAELDDILF